MARSRARRFSSRWSIFWAGCQSSGTSTLAPFCWAWCCSPAVGSSGFWPDGRWRMTDPVLATHGITKSFGAVQASRDISLSLNPGEIHAVIGPNGAGKSTLIAQICGGLMPDAGQVQFLGEDVTTLPTRKRARMGLARTFQISALAQEDTVLQNVTLGALGARGGALGLIRNALKDKDLRDTAMGALERVDLAQEASTVTAELSHGQRRQLEV